MWGCSVSRTTLTKRGQTVIPAVLRRRYGIVEGTQLEWLDTGVGLKVIPVPGDPITALRGIGRGERLTERLLAERRRDRARE
ncbi:MAG: AbrB/MazE/SpoVT family DNA-binding domain-containing protein [Chloroflexi bacterium]|nr:AbrB/MazE/SpoVT family DNA-binding domain-containing protein [Chloroflexota bacterium]